MVEKLLIIGQGFLGNRISDVAENSSINIIGTHYNKKGNFLDISKIELVEKMINTIEPDYIINSAAITDLDKIELDSRDAYKINSEGVKNIALVSAKNKIRLIHISTDSVFDGRKGMYKEEDIPNPINEYAKTKKLGEDYVKNFADNYVIIRTNFYGYNNSGRFLFNWVLKNLQNKEKIIAFQDIVFNPLEITNLSEMILEIIHNNFIGTIHLSADEVITKYDFAVKIATELNFDLDLVSKGYSTDMKFIAKRPLNTSLSNQKAKNMLKTKPKSLEYWLNNEFRNQVQYSS